MSLRLFSWTKWQLNLTHHRCRTWAERWSLLTNHRLQPCITESGLLLSLASTYELHCLHCTSGYRAHNLLCCFSSLPSASWDERKTWKINRAPSSAASPKSSCFLLKKFLRESAFLLAYATRSSFRGAWAQARRPHRYDSPGSLRSVSYRRSTLPVSTIYHVSVLNYHRARR